MSQCPICGRDRNDKFCSYHQEAYDNLKEMHEKWKTAAGLTWDDYLERISEIDTTGRWVLDIIEYITQEDGLEEKREVPS